MSTIVGTDLFIMEQSGVNYVLTADRMQTDVLNLPPGNLFIIDRNGNSYKASITEFINYLTA